MGLSRNKLLRKIIFGITGCVSGISPVLSSHLAYFFARKKILHLNPPRDLNEKLMWLKLNIYNYHPDVCLCADKLAMRDYVEAKGCPELLIPLYHVWESADDIDFEQLPKRFAMKCNHGSGFNLICQNKETLDVEQTRDTLYHWMKTDYWRRSAELNYKNITRRIFCEELLVTKNGSLPSDYKIMCYYGEPQYILYCCGRGSDLKYLNFSIDWKLLSYNRDHCEEEIQKPKSLDKMLYYAKLLSKEFPAVRMDFYDNDGEPILGEMTFTPAGCLGIALDQDGLDYFGERLELKTELVKKMYNEAQKYKRTSGNKSKVKNKKGKGL